MLSLDFNNSTDLSNLLNMPVAYLLQENKIEDISKLRDVNNYSLLHCSVLNNNLEKVLELLNFNFNTKVLTQNSEIPLVLIKKFINFEFNNLFKISFLKEGYTALHLNIFLLNYYTHLKPEKGNFAIEKFKDKQQKILDLFIEYDSHCIGITDQSGFSLFDYAILLENNQLINKFYKLNNNFSFLNNVNKDTALKILKLINIKKQKVDNKEISIEPIEDIIIINLEKIILFEKLQLDLEQKNNVKYLHKI